MKLIIKILVPVAILALGFGLSRWVVAAGPERSQTSTTATDERPFVRSQMAERGDFAAQVLVWGQMQAQQSLDMTVNQNLRLAEVLVELGQEVEAGQLLIRPDQGQLQLQLQQTQAQLQAFDSQLASTRQRFASDRELLALERSLLGAAESELERQQTLSRRNLSTAAQLEQAQNALVQRQLSLATRQLAVNSQNNEEANLLAQRRQLESQVAQLQWQLDDNDLRAPFAGRVAQLHAQVGQRAGQQPLLRLVSQASEVRAWVPRAGNLQTFVEAEVTGLGLSSEQIQQSQEAQQGATEVRVRFDSPQAQQRLGQAVRLQLSLAPTDALRLPDSSLYPGNQVFVIEDGRLQAKPVQLLGHQSVDGHSYVLLAPDPELTQRPILTSRLSEASTGLLVQTQEAE